ncbi:MAG: hypothetical protein KC766_27170, partial [Myxococcales bacterium]|nr:hypothetical protein [Myxococcales bacterium]
DLAQYEAELPVRLEELHALLSDGSWFDQLDVGEVWIVPKRLNGDSADDGVVRVGTTAKASPPVLDVQVRLSPSPAFAIAELLYLRHFGPVLDGLLSKNSIGYRLDLRTGELDATRRWTFEYWPRRYQEFRSAPLNHARAALRRASSSVMVVSADLASFYDSIDPSFLLSEAFLARLLERGLESRELFEGATRSLLAAFGRFRAKAESRLGVPVRTGVPIGSLTSRVVANLSLSTLDEHIEAQPDVLSYRRYVDDLVVVASAPESVTVDAALSQLLPLRESSDHGFVLDVEALQRAGCEFELQRRKIKVHHLAGEPGEDFVEAVLTDFDRLVSRSQAFLDTAALLDDGATHLIRARDGEGSPLRVLRDADRTRLERFALSTSLRTLERATVLLDAEEAQRVVRATLERVGRVLAAEDDWVESLDTALRLLRVAIGTKDWESARDLNNRFEEVFGTVDAVTACVGTLRYRGESIDRSRRGPWTWLRNYLHARRLESVASALPGSVTPDDVATWAPNGLTVRTASVGAVALRRRAQELAAADLRTYDREDDHSWPVQDFAERWMEGDLPELAERFESIRVFLGECARLKDDAWLMPAARLFLATRPPSYFDVARRLMYAAESEGGFSADVFDRLLAVVNALRGTRYYDSVGRVLDPHTLAIPWTVSDRWGRTVVASDQNPSLVLGNLVVPDEHWRLAAERTARFPRGRPVHTVQRLLGLMRVIARATHVAKPRRGSGQGGTPTLLVLPELTVPRRWFRAVATHVVRHGGFGAVMGLEYLHDPSGPFVLNQAFAVLPGPFGAVATWPWTKRWPADGEGEELAGLTPPLRFRPRATDPPRVVVETSWGRFSTLICSELIEARRVADLLGRAELVLCPAWNRDTASYDHLIQSVGFQLHAIVAVANNGHYSDCRAWAPLSVRWKRDLCRLIEREVDDIVQVPLPMRSLIEFHESAASAPPPKGAKPDWRPLPPNWPRRSRPRSVWSPSPVPVEWLTPDDPTDVDEEP